MKRLIVLTLGLTTIVLLSNLPTAGAAVGDCHVSCCNGASYDGPLPSGYSNCCSLFGSLCGYIGDAYTETAWGEEYCPNLESCGF